jgi:hypothetical protein
MAALRNGPCAPWVQGPQVKEQLWVAAAATRAEAAGLDVDALCAEAAAAASEILYELSGRTFTGSCGPVTVRPLARPTDIDSRAWAARFPMGWSGSWGACGAYGASTGVASHYGCSNPPEIDLGAYPVNEIVQVLIDGIEIPADEYELRNYRTLVRLRPTASTTPTERWGWPTCQINDLPDTEPGTFSVTYLYGQPPPTSGVLAAEKLAEYLVLPKLGDTTRYPARVTNVTRQGVTSSVADIMDTVKDGGTGIYEVELFLNAVNPHRAERQGVVWSPDMGRPRRTNPS